MITEGKFRVPIYEFIVKVTIFDNLEEAREKYPKFMTGDLIGCTVEYFDSKCHLIVPSDKLSTIVHELEHTKNIIWKVKGVTCILDNDEPDAYLMGYLFEQVEKILRKHLASRC